jgi:pimeloyl-ACP methyl ester carboxylesterase
MTRTISLAGTTLELIERGQGRSLLFLHAGEGLAPERPWLDLLAKRYCVIAPSHPGYGNSPLIDGGAGGVDDLAYLYLDLAAELGLEDAVLVGADLGGWIAAEMMVRSTARFSCLVLVAPLGIKLRGRDERDTTCTASSAPNICGLPGPTRRRARPTTPRCPIPNWRRSCEAAKPSRFTAGSPTCTTRA